MIGLAMSGAIMCLIILVAEGGICQAEPAGDPPGDPYGIRRKPLPASVVVLTATVPQTQPLK